MHPVIAAGVRIEQFRFGPAEAELLVSFPWHEAETLPELRGRLMGPRCARVSTIEVAHYLKPLPRQPGAKDSVGRIVIPDPSFWDPGLPHLYEGPLELWHQGQPHLQVKASLGLRTCSLGSRGLLWNGYPLSFLGRATEKLDEAAAQLWHELGYNLAVISASAITPGSFDTADRQGVLVLPHVRSQEEVHWPIAAAPLSPSWLGCLLDPPLLEDETLRERLRLSGRLIGVHLTDSVPGTLPTCDFVCCSAELVPAAVTLGLPILLRGGRADGAKVLGHVVE